MQYKDLDDASKEEFLKGNNLYAVKDKNGIITLSRTV
jgi:hypothetical protein